jgi:hypothetical protein
MRLRKQYSSPAQHRIIKLLLLSALVCCKTSYAQSSIQLRCENFTAKWEVTIALDMQLIFTKMQIAGTTTFDDVWKIVQSGDRFIRGNFIEVDKQTKKPRVVDNWSVVIDRYDSKLLHGDMNDEKRPMLQYDCVKVDRKF